MITESDFLFHVLYRRILFISLARARYFRKFVLALVLTCCGLVSSALAQSGTPTPTPMPLSTFILQDAITQDCPAGFTCNNFRVTNPDATLNERGVIAVQAPTGQIKGVVVFFSGSDGYLWWGDPAKQALIPAFFQSLLDAGLELVQVRHSWVVASTGVQSGQELLASRPATVIKWVYDNIYAPLGLSHGIGECGFCITGNSGGSSQVAYALSTYGLDSIVDAAVPTSGPTHADISKGCLQEPGYDYDNGNIGIIDLSYG